MQILPIEKKFQRSSSLDYRLVLIADYQMVAKELFLRHLCLCVYQEIQFDLRNFIQPLAMNLIFSKCFKAALSITTVC